MNVKDFGAKGDVKTVYDDSIEAGKTSNYLVLIVKILYFVLMPDHQDDLRLYPFLSTYRN